MSQILIFAKKDCGYLAYRIRDWLSNSERCSRLNPRVLKFGHPEIERLRTLNTVVEILKRFDRWIISSPKRSAIQWGLLSLGSTFVVVLMLRNEPFGLIVFVCVIVGVIGTIVSLKRMYDSWRQYKAEVNGNDR